MEHLIETKKLDLTDIISGGGDYELVFTAPPNVSSDILNLAKDKVNSGEWNLEDILGEGEFIE